jgi:hypothetical protein
MKGVFF